MYREYKMARSFYTPDTCYTLYKNQAYLMYTYLGLGYVRVGVGANPNPNP